MSTHLGHIVDTSTASGGSRTSSILAEVCKVVSPDPSGTGYPDSSGQKGCLSGL
ncbi:MAG: hypothetical protein JO269_11200 [Burkholderiaceae bacterium]|nr:hypothetical protein [Burkholderiaceae bacterium]